MQLERNWIAKLDVAVFGFILGRLIAEMIHDEVVLFNGLLRVDTNVDLGRGTSRKSSHLDLGGDSDE